MNYEQFICAMYECAKNKVSEKEKVEKQEILKNNGVVYVGLSIRKREQQVAPLIYLEPFYEKYQKGFSVEELSDYLICQARNASGAPEWDYTTISEFHKVKDRVIFKLINAEKNERLLKEVPSLPMMDFAIVFYLMITENEEENCTVLIRNSHMELWECPISVLYHYATINTPRLCPPEFHPMSDFVDLLPDYAAEEMLYVLTNRKGLNGASVIIYPEMPKMLYEILGSNYYLLPSSVHEFLIVPEREESSPLKMRTIVREVNASEVTQEEFLSDNIYYFNGDIITKL